MSIVDIIPELKKKIYIYILKMIILLIQLLERLTLKNTFRIYIIKPLI